MNPHPNDYPEWLAHEALENAKGNTATAVDRLRGAVEVLLLWQRIALFDAEPDVEGPTRG